MGKKNGIKWVGEKLHYIEDKRMYIREVIVGNKLAVDNKDYSMAANIRASLWHSLMCYSMPRAARAFIYYQETGGGSGEDDPYKQELARAGVIGDGEIQATAWDRITEVYTHGLVQMYEDQISYFDGLMGFKPTGRLSPEENIKKIWNQEVGKRKPRNLIKKLRQMKTGEEMTDLGKLMLKPRIEALSLLICFLTLATEKFRDRKDYIHAAFMIGVWKFINEFRTDNHMTAELWQELRRRGLASKVIGKVRRIGYIDFDLGKKKLLAREGTKPAMLFRNFSPRFRSTPHGDKTRIAFWTPTRISKKDLEILFKNSVVMWDDVEEKDFT